MVATPLPHGIALTDIFREIDEELRRDNLQQLWKKYGNYVIALAVLVVAATAGVVGWRAYQDSQRAAQGVEYSAALDLVRQGKDADAAAAFASLAKTADSGRALLARFEEAASRVQSGDVPAAITLYDQIATDGSVDQGFRDVATILSARYMLDKAGPEAVEARLQPLASGAGPWHGLALELTALAEMKAGDTAKARGDFEALSKDTTAPSGVRQRAGVMLETFSP